ncbi:MULTISPECIES: chemotaxis protein CheB [Sphingobacterium]|uniref:protein-glutamate methylesterase n=1 Tax=Sphingobacterium litopenaei TaxID=2763500 RepID=A0ABR7YA05_9SPHI|nr:MULTISPECIES: chemotaxis protein CheB [Sphingobacterium]MBD1428138.1 chemotaxis protein CheB [Sphingobacterium litopenaei]NGM73121.1 chemotaxis protein CheB [Sphingobacterium sp. SGL-16]
MNSETKVLLIGGSAGSISVLFQMLPEINTDIHFPIIIILHRKSYPKSSLSQLFETMTSLNVIEVEDKTEIAEGNIYLVPADYHLLFENENTISLDASEKVNYSRPSIDVTFESAARTFNNSVTAILLSGASQDGVEGLKNIKQHGGKVAIQDPNSAEVDYMPRHALEQLPDIIQLQPPQMAQFINNLK